MHEVELDHIDIRGPAAAPAVAAALRGQGLAVFRGMTDRSQFTEFAAGLMALRNHRDAEPDGITDIKPDPRRVEAFAGQGFSHGAVAPHTEGSSLPQPPGLLMLVCESQATEGGMTILVDAAEVHRSLAAEHPKKLAALAEPGVVQFGADALPAEVFESLERGKVAVRYRDDDLVQVNSSAETAWTLLRETIHAHRRFLMLRAGEGMVLCNRRWLHGRTGFLGARLIQRAIGDAHADLDISAGFSPASQT